MFYNEFLKLIQHFNLNKLLEILVIEVIVPECPIHEIMELLVSESKTRMILS